MRLPHRVRLPDSSLDRVRALFYAFSLVVGIPVAAQILLAQHSAAMTTLSLLSLGALLARWSFGYERRQFRAILDPLEVLALTLIAYGVGDYTKALGLIFVGAQFRALYGGVREAYFRTALYGVAVIAAALAAPGVGQEIASAVPTLPTLILVSGITHYLARMLLAHVALERTLRQSEARFRAVVHNTGDVILVIGSDGRIQFHTPSASRLFGVPDADLVGRPIQRFVHPDDVAPILEVAGAPPPQDTSLVLRVLNEQSQAWLQVEVLVGGAIDGEVTPGVVLTLRDVTERKALEHRLRHEAAHDALTQLPNRSELRRAIDAAMVGSTVGGTELGVLFVDLDDFKSVNDTLGHGAGDELLVGVAHRLRGCVHGDDMVARLGGDEFAILVTRLRTPNDASTIAQRILAAIEPPFAVAGRQLFVRASIGVVTSNGLATSVDDLLRRADTAMYSAKGHGKARVECFEPSMGDEIERRVALEADLRAGLDGGQLFLEFQPIVRLADRRVIGAEALVRWRHPVRGVIPPLDFIDLAEQTGLAVPLGRQVLRRAMETLSEWRLSPLANEPFAMSVNLSASQLLDPLLVADLEDLLTGCGLPASALVVEVTETVLMQDAPAIGHRLEELKRLGVRIALDDFGTGYTSLAYLHRFPVDVLKVDRTFVRDLGDDPKKAALTRSIVALSVSLGFTAVPEGIETEAQCEMLRSYGALFGQGYLFGRPISSRAFVERHLLVDVTARVA